MGKYTVKEPLDFHNKIVLIVVFEHYVKPFIKKYYNKECSLVKRKIKGDLKYQISEAFESFDIYDFFTQSLPDIVDCEIYFDVTEELCEYFYDLVKGENFTLLDD